MRTDRRRCSQSGRHLEGVCEVNARGEFRMAIDCTTSLQMGLCVIRQDIIFTVSSLAGEYIEVKSFIATRDQSSNRSETSLMARSQFL